jgi:hypothetical protein
MKVRDMFRKMAIKLEIHLFMATFSFCGDSIHVLTVI